MREFLKLVDLLNPAVRFSVSRDLELISERVKARQENEMFQKHVDEADRLAIESLTDSQRALRAAFSSSRI
jgi:hypothetical protein